MYQSVSPQTNGLTDWWNLSGSDTIRYICFCCKVWRMVEDKYDHCCWGFSESNAKTPPPLNTMISAHPVYDHVFVFHRISQANQSIHFNPAKVWVLSETIYTKVNCKIGPKVTHRNMSFWSRHKKPFILTPKKAQFKPLAWQQTRAEWNSWTTFYYGAFPCTAPHPCQDNGLIRHCCHDVWMKPLSFVLQGTKTATL